MLNIIRRISFLMRKGNKYFIRISAIHFKLCWINFIRKILINNTPLKFRKKLFLKRQLLILRFQRSSKSRWSVQFKNAGYIRENYTFIKIETKREMRLPSTQRNFEFLEPFFSRMNIYRNRQSLYLWDLQIFRGFFNAGTEYVKTPDLCTHISIPEYLLFICEPRFHSVSSIRWLLRARPHPRRFII